MPGWMRMKFSSEQIWIPITVGCYILSPMHKTLKCRSKLLHTTVQQQLDYIVLGLYNNVNILLIKLATSKIGLVNSVRERVLNIYHM